MRLSVRLLISLPHFRARDMNLEDVPKFCDHTGEALNAAALALVREATSVEYIAAHAPAEGSILVDVPAIDVASGRHKYVLVQLSDRTKAAPSSSFARTRGVRTTRTIMGNSCAISTASSARKPSLVAS